MSDRKKPLKLPTSPFLSINQVCEILGKTKKRPDGSIVYLRYNVDDAIRERMLRAYCIGRGSRKRKLVVHPDDLTEFLAAGRVK